MLRELPYTHFLQRSLPQKEGIVLMRSEKQLRLTPKESNRLRQVSYERQLERGMSRPGYAGLTVERFGDAEPFHPAPKVSSEQEVAKHERE